MYANRFTAVLDACVLAPALTRNLLLSLAREGLFRPRWSLPVLAETERAIVRILTGKGADDPEGRAARACDQMRNAFPDNVVAGFEALIPAVTGLGDDDDRHVVAAAIKTKASVIVTDNAADFPEAALAPFELEALKADDFIANSIDLDEVAAVRALAAMRQRLQRPRLSVDDLIFALERNGLTATANLIEPLREFI